MSETRTLPTTCPHCDSFIDAATGVTDETAVPKEGDLSICVVCREISIFRADQTLRAPTDAELVAIQSLIDREGVTFN